MEENRTVVLVVSTVLVWDKCTPNVDEQTNNIAMTRPIAHFIVTLGSDGRIKEQGLISEISGKSSLAGQIQQEQQILKKSQQEVDFGETVCSRVRDPYAGSRFS